MRFSIFVIFYTICVTATGNHGGNGQGGAGHGVSYGLPRSSSYLTNLRKYIPYTTKTADLHDNLMRKMYGIKNWLYLEKYKQTHLIRLMNLCSSWWWTIIDETSLQVHRASHTRALSFNVKTLLRVKKWTWCVFKINCK